ncbi:MAG: MlaD family protein [Candidatus Sericytochromatia bacterium]|nr:MlaD family protein [Candidatus Sericytochromatia bacterium]
MLSPAAKVGAATLFSVFALGAGLSWLTHVSLTPKGYSFQVRFADVAGLLPGATVRYMGLRVGRIETLTPRGPLIEVSVHVDDATLQLPANGRYKIMSLGIIGEKALEIFPPKAPLARTGQPTPSPVPIVWLKPDDAVRGEDPSRLELVLDEVTDTFQEFRKAADPKKFEKLFAETAQNLAHTTKTVDQLGTKASSLLDGLSSTPKGLNDLIASLSRLSAGSERLVAATSPKEVAAAVRDVRQVTRNVSRTLDALFGPGQQAANKRSVSDVRHLISRLDQLVTTMNNTAGDPNVQQDIRDTVRNIRDLTRGLTGAAAITEPRNLQGFSLEPTVQGIAMYPAAGTGLAANLGVKLKLQTNTITAGVEQVGEGPFFNLTLGDTHVWGPAGYHFGLIRSKIGVGIDYALPNRIQLMGQIYDPNRPTIRLGATYFPFSQQQYGLLAQFARTLPSGENLVWGGLEWRPASDDEKRHAASKSP